MSITDELRKWWVRKFPVMDKELHEDFTAIADRIDIAHKHAIGYVDDRDPEIMAENGWGKLPRDANGEYVHVGDVMENGMTRGRVIALMLSEYPKEWGGGLHWSVQLEGEHAPTTLDFTFRHYHAPTVEDVLLDACKAYHGLMVESMNDVAHDMPAPSEVIAEYAAKLRLKED